MDHGAGNRHVRFGEESDEFPSGNHIIIQKNLPFALEVHLGFLRLGHIYQITVPFHISEHLSGIIDWVPDESLSSPYAKIVNCGQTPEGTYNVVFEFKAGKPKLMKEALKLHSALNSATILELVLLARVLGKGQGTPMLKDGIHCVGVEMDDESEASDWQGFE